MVPTLNRVCTKEYRIPGTKIVLEKGTSIMIPAFSLQRDEKYYPNPTEFDPSRFFSENKQGKSIVDMPFLAFGKFPFFFSFARFFQFLFALSFYYFKLFQVTGHVLV